MKRIVFIPPDGQFKKQDFLLDRIYIWLAGQKQYSITTLCSNSEFIPKTITGEIRVFDNREQILAYLKKHPFTYIITRGWMHSYKFSSLISELFENVITIIKDWNFSTKEEYRFLFSDTDDFSAISSIFKNSLYVLSHFTDEQARLWAKEYNLTENKFIFFPDFCQQDYFCNKSTNYYPDGPIKLVFAGTIPPSSYPEQFYSTKGLIRTLHTLKKQNIRTSIVMPPNHFDFINNEKRLFSDLLYEHKFNEHFNLVRGNILTPKVLDCYDFGFFLLDYTTKSTLLNRYAVPSKTAFYLEAGIPMLVNSRLESLARLVDDHGLGLIFCNEDLPDIRTHLQINRSHYKDMLENIRIFRNSFSCKLDNILSDDAF